MRKLSALAKNKVFAEFLKTVGPKSKVLVLTHDSPDPDAIASAAAIGAFLSELYSAEVDIAYGGQISHPQNKAMVNVLNSPLKKIEAIAPIGEYDKVILVDGSRVSLPKIKREGGEDEEPVLSLVIDHHDDDPPESTEFVIKQDVGACSSIVAGLTYPMLISDEVDLEMRQKLYTALALGIRTDTGEFTNNVSTLDKEAYQHLQGNIDWNKTISIMNYTIPSQLLVAKAAAFDRWYRKEESTIVTGVGRLKPENKDFLAIIADELIRCQGTEKVVVMGLMDGHLVASVRTDTVTTNTADFCHRVFGREQSGGRHGAGGARLKIDLIAGDASIGTQDDVWHQQHDEKMFEILFDTFSKKVFQEQGK